MTALRLKSRADGSGVVYQLGNFIASINAPMQAWIAGQTGGDYALSLAPVVGTVAIVIAILTAGDRSANDGTMESARRRVCCRPSGEDRVR